MLICRENRINLSLNQRTDPTRSHLTLIPTRLDPTWHDPTWPHVARLTCMSAITTLLQISRARHRTRKLVGCTCTTWTTGTCRTRSSTRTVPNILDSSWTTPPEWSWCDTAPGRASTIWGSRCTTASTRRRTFRPTSRSRSRRYRPRQSWTPGPYASLASPMRISSGYGITGWVTLPLRVRSSTRGW